MNIPTLIKLSYKILEHKFKQNTKFTVCKINEASGSLITEV